MSGNFEVCPVGTVARLAAVEAERDALRLCFEVTELERSKYKAERNALLAVVQAYIVWSEAEPVQRKPATGAESCVPSPSFQMTTQAEPVQREDYENRQCASAIRARGS